jgi:predicted dehydrogenase
MSLQPLRCAVVGVGHLGRWHAEKYARLPDSQLIAVVDPDAAAADRIAAEHGAESLRRHEDLIGRVDAVSIAAPTSLHFPIARDLLTAGIHVLVEKPITVTVAEAAELNRVAERQQRILQVGHLERFNPALMRLRANRLQPRFIESHRLAPFQLRATDVSVVLDLMIHDIDIILDLVRSPLVDLRATGAQVMTKDIDIANARLEFADGCVANVTSSRVSTRYERRMRIFQPMGYSVIDFQARSLSTYALKATETGEDPAGFVEERWQGEAADALLDEIRNFLGAIRGDVAVAVDGRAGQRALETAIQITELVHHNLHVFEPAPNPAPTGGAHA